MRSDMSFEEWLESATDEEINELIVITKKRFRIFLLISLIPFINWITMGCAIFCYNNLSYLKSRGRYGGSNELRTLLMIYAFIIPPIIVVKLCSSINSLGMKVLGW